MGNEVILFLFVLEGTYVVFSQFSVCHDDPSFEPEEGVLGNLQFNWLGALQYIHVKNATPHYFRVPRVVLISRQFVLSTAVDAAQIPDGYALGNVIFGDYERDEWECSLTLEELSRGAECPPVILHMPIADVLLHPEYKHFGAKNSIALLKLLTPVRSSYVLPVCLPFKNFLFSKKGKATDEKIYHVDFPTDVPRDFLEEEKEVRVIKLLPRELCFMYDSSHKSAHLMKTRVVCTTDCGFHSGAASVVHEHTGHWNIVALSYGGSPCSDPLRNRRPPPLPRHILIYPYVTWITAAIAGKPIGDFSKDDPFGFMMPRASFSYDDFAVGWVGHWWMGGLRCYDRGESAVDLFKFYHEVFQVKPDASIFLTYNLELASANMANIICVKVGMPYQIATPKITQLDSPTIRVQIPAFRLRYMYQFQVQAWAYNTSRSSSSSSATESDSKEDSEQYLLENSSNITSATIS